MKLIHLEDDPFYADLIAAELSTFAKVDKVPLQLERIRTERQFIKDLPRLLAEGDAFLLDVMVRWAFPEDEDSETGSANSDYYYYAGIRCADLILKNLPVTPAKNIVLYTVYKKAELRLELERLPTLGPHHLEVITKDENLNEVWQKLNRSLLT